uniref:hypothetical protein n=2 Tax=Acetomicrobium TaxID=49894 RepID=UPI002B25B5FA
DVMVFKKEYGLHNKKDDYRGEYSLAVPRVHVSTAENLFRGLFKSCLSVHGFAYCDYEAYKTLLSWDKPDEEPKSLENARWLDSTRRLALVFDGKYLYLARISPDDEKTGKKGERYFYKFKTIDILKELIGLFDATVENASKFLRQKEEAINDDSYLEIIR